MTQRQEELPVASPFDQESDEAYVRKMIARGGYQYLEYEFRSRQAPHTSAYVWEPVLAQLKRHLQGTHILDAGCGNGAFAKRLTELEGLDVCGVDLSQSGVKIAREICPRGRFALASVDDELVKLFGRPFDAVVSLEVIEHLYDPRAFVESIRNVLRPEGLFIVTTPYHGYLKNLVMALTNKMDHHFTALWDGGHIKFWSRKTLTRLLEEKGFEVIDFAGAGRFPYLWKSMILTARVR